MQLQFQSVFDMTRLFHVLIHSPVGTFSGKGKFFLGVFKAV